MKNLASLLENLKEKNVRLKVENGRIKFQDPEKFVQGDVLEQIKQQKQEIIALLERSASTTEIASSYVEGQNIPISKFQKPLLFSEYLSESDASLNLSMCYKYKKGVKLDTLDDALRHLVQEETSLRLGYVFDNNNWKAQLNSADTFSIEKVSISELEIKQQYGSIGEYSLQYIKNKFVFDGSPLSRIRICELDCGEILLAISIHHSICDGLSLSNLSQKLDMKLFKPEDSGEANNRSASYLDYLVWQEKKGHAEGIAYWENQLANVPSNINLPTDFTRPTNVTSTSASSQLSLDTSSIEKLKQLSKKYQVSHFTILLAAFYCLLNRHTSQEDLVVGVPFSNRDHPEIQKTVGMFINTLPIRVKLSESMTFEALLEQVFSTVKSATNYQQTPLLDIIEAVNPARSASYSPLFQVLVNYLDIESGWVNHFAEMKSEVEFEQVKDKITQFDITLNIINREGEFELDFEYSTALFSNETIQRYKAHYAKLLSCLLENPTRKINEHSILTDDEVTFLKEINSEVSAAQSLSNPYLSLVKTAQDAPNRQAILFQDTTLTYAQLHSKIERVAEQLTKAGIKKGDRVGLYFVRSPEMVSAMYACFKLGAIYVPIDPAYPKNRVQYIIDDTRLSCILSLSILSSLLSKFELSIPTVSIDKESDDLSKAVATESLSENDSAYIIHTSGSTGRPKGVNISHGNLHNLLMGLDETFKENKVQKWLAQTSINFDISIVELIWTLTRGNTIVLQQHRNKDLVNIGTQKAHTPLKFSIMFFSDDGNDHKKYDLMIDSAKYGDQNGFNAVWLPERHFGKFGGAFPNPAISCAALSTITKNINLRAGSVVLPLHDPIRVAEEWSMIDNLSNGRVGLAFASGWHPNDFVFEGSSYADRRDQLREKLGHLKTLWEGGAISRKNGLGNEQEVRTRPTPKQETLPTWITAAGNPETFEYAGSIGANILTHMLGQSIEQLESNIAVYHRALRSNGYSIESKEITLMLHTYLDKSEDIALSTAEVPFKNYIDSSLNLMKPIAEEFGIDIEENRSQINDIAFNRLSKTSALFGSAESCQQLLNQFHEIGITEIASLVDFGVDNSKVLNSLEIVTKAKEIYQAEWSLGKHLSTAHYKSELELISEHKVSHVQMTPSQMKVLLKQYQSNPLPLDVERWLLGGENLTQELVTQLKSVSSGQCYNMYGPTETTVWSAWLNVSKTGVFIGKPCLNTQFYLLDKSLQPVPVGVTGELYIGGKGLSKGYWEKVDLTSKSFKHINIEGLFDGQLYKTSDLMKLTSDGLFQYMGRTDDQIKINGYRIELNEIERNLQGIQGIQDCRVVAKRNASDENYLAAYVVKSDIIVGDWTKLPSEQEAKPFTFADGSLVYHQSDHQLGGLYQEIFEDNIYLKNGIELLPNDLVLDVGANMGTFSMFAQQCQPTVNIIAFEPIPDTFSSLKKNFESRNINGLIYNCGISDKKETATFTYYHKMSGLSGRFSNTEKDKLAAKVLISEGSELEKLQIQGEVDSYLDDIYQSKEVECQLDTISNVIRRHNIRKIDLLKVDIEKSECLALKGIEQDDWQKIKQIVIEVDGDDNLEFVTKLLSKQGFELTVDDYISAKDDTDQLNVYMLYGVNRKFSSAGTNDFAVFANPSKADIKNTLLANLPEFMVPTEIHFIDKIPLLKNGKVDNAALRKVEKAEPELQSTNFATNENEIKIEKIWKSIINRDACPIDISFFELGGTSLGIVALHSQIQSEFSVAIKIVDLFRYKTIKEQADFVALKIKDNDETKNTSNVIKTRERKAIPKRRRSTSGFS